MIKLILPILKTIIVKTIIVKTIILKTIIVKTIVFSFLKDHTSGLFSKTIVFCQNQNDRFRKT